MLRRMNTLEREPILKKDADNFEELLSNEEYHDSMLPLRKAH